MCVKEDVQQVHVVNDSNKIGELPHFPGKMNLEGDFLDVVPQSGDFGVPNKCDFCGLIFLKSWGSMRHGFNKKHTHKQRLG